MDLTTHRTMGLRDALGGQPAVALAAVTHALAVAVFYPPYERAICLEIKLTGTPIGAHAQGMDDTPATLSLAKRHAGWAARMPKAASEAWAFVQGLGSGELLDLLTHCASLTVNCVHISWERKPIALAHADRLAQAVGLDMSAYWTATEASYFSRVTKPMIAAAVREAVSDEAAERISGLRKPEMAAEAEVLTTGTKWLPALLRKPESPKASEQSGAVPTQEAALTRGNRLGFSVLA